MAGSHAITMSVLLAAYCMAITAFAYEASTDLREASFLPPHFYSVTNANALQVFRIDTPGKNAVFTARRHGIVLITADASGKSLYFCEKSAFLNRHSFFRYEIDTKKESFLGTKEMGFLLTDFEYREGFGLLVGGRSDGLWLLPESGGFVQLRCQETFLGLASRTDSYLRWFGSPDAHQASDVHKVLSELVVYEQVTIGLPTNRKVIPLNLPSPVFGFSGGLFDEGSTVIGLLVIRDLEQPRELLQVWRLSEDSLFPMSTLKPEQVGFQYPFTWGWDGGQFVITHLGLGKSVPVDYGKEEFHDVLIQPERVLLLVGDEPHLIERPLKFEN